MSTLFAAEGKLILGTVQLGMAYGIANTTGQPEQSVANAIIQSALDNGVDFFDTAQAYGASEAVLGRALQACTASAHIITKLAPQLPESPEELEESIRQSLHRLGLKQAYCLMLHREEQLPLLDVWQGRVLSAVRDKGITRLLGISVYTPEMALRAVAHPLISVVQIPASLFDRRFERAGVFAAAKAAQKELHIRSVFLQGVLCMAPDHLPAMLRPLRPALLRVQELAQEYACSTGQLALSWMLMRYPQCKCIFGAEAAEQVLQNIDYARQASKLPREVYAELDAVLPPQHAELLNPALWQR